MYSFNKEQLEIIIVKNMKLFFMLFFSLILMSCNKEDDSEPNVSIIFPKDSTTLFTNTNYVFEAEMNAKGEISQTRFNVRATENPSEKWSSVFVGEIEGTSATQQLSINIPSIDTAYGWYDVSFSAVGKNGVQSEIINKKINIVSNLDTIKPIIIIDEASLADTLEIGQSYLLNLQIEDKMNDGSWGDIEYLSINLSRNSTIVFSAEITERQTTPYNDYLNIDLSENLQEGEYAISINVIDAHRNQTKKTIYRNLKL